MGTCAYLWACFAAAPLALVWAIALVTTPLAAQGRARPAIDDAAFFRELKASNAAHLQDSVAWPAQKPTPLIDSLDAAGKSRRLQVEAGDVEVRIEFRRDDKSGTEGAQIAILVVTVAGKVVARIGGAQSGFTEAPYLAQIVEMDGSNRYPEVVFSTFTGGAHCCADVRIVTSAPDGRRWRAVEAGKFDGGLYQAQDIDGDGRYELALPDDRFFYAFACYACSSAPMRVLRLDRDRIIDVSTEASYRVAHAAWLKLMIEASQPDVDRNGFLAGYVAEKIRLGEGKEAWALMLESYDRSSDWGLEQDCSERGPRTRCKDGKVKLDFPAALRRHLEKTGYKPPR